MLRKFQIVEGKIIPTCDDPAPIWVFASPDDTEKKLLVETYSVDEHTLNSALDPDEVSRLEFEPEHMAIIFKRPKSYTAEDNLLFKVASAGLFLFKDRLVMVLTEDIPLFDAKQFVKASSPAEVLLRLIYRTTFHFIEHLRVITAISDSLEDKIDTSMENTYLLQMFALEKSLVYYLSAINANSIVIDRLRNNATRIGLTPEQLELLEDVAIENQQCYKQAEIYSNILASMVAARASIVNNNLSAMMKTLNIITIGIMVPTLVVSAFSMNVRIPLSTHSHAFWLIMGLAVVAMSGFLAVWRFKRW
jgi:magnesium transporter